MRQTFQELIESTENFLARKVERNGQWCQKSWPDCVQTLKKRQGRLGDRWHIDEVYVTIQGQLQYLWRAVDQGGDVIAR